MALRNTLTQSKNLPGAAFVHKSGAGFTLIEILIAIAILAIIIAFGLFVSFDFYKSYAFRSERSIIVSALQKARDQSLSNIDQTRHGVHFTTTPSLQYIIFECPGNNPQCASYLATPSVDIPIYSSYGISITNLLPPPHQFDVIFNQLDGNCILSTTATLFNCDPVNQPIIVSDGIKSYKITVNSEGQIDTPQ